jgi:hypothetical protein
MLHTMHAPCIDRSRGGTKSFHWITYVYGSESFSLAAGRGTGRGRPVDRLIASMLGTVGG